jgi:pimeloyl-ACP methyl ester carboxylesterase
VPLVQVNGLTLHAQEMGSGSPVVLLHGIAVSNLSLWYFSAAPVLAERHRVLLYDQRGHGLSETPPAGYSAASLSGDLEALLDRISSEPEPVDLVGFSFGGIVALRFALGRLERVRRLVLVEMPLPPLAPFWLQSFRDPAVAEQANLLPPALEQALTRSGRQALRHEERLRMMSEETTLSADLEAEPEITEAELGRLTLPVLLCYGTETACPGAAEYLQRALPEATVEIVEGRHYLPIESPGPLSAAIAGFLDA